MWYCTSKFYLVHNSEIFCLVFNYGTGIQGKGSLISCTKSQSIVIVVTLPMTKTAFIAIEENYIVSVASTAGVIRENVKILGIDEISTRTSKVFTQRLLLTTSVNVQTSILIAVNEQTYIANQTVLNSNLNKNGLPSGTLVVQYPPGHTVTSLVNETTPAPDIRGSGGSVAENSSGSSSVPVGVIVGGVVGFVFFFAGILLALHKRKTNQTRKTGESEVGGEANQAGAGNPSLSSVIVTTRSGRPNRHAVDILEIPQYKPLRLIEGFVPSKTCREYVEQDCTEALPVFRQHSRNLIQCGSEVS
jgi:hypothetical protein